MFIVLEGIDGAGKTTIINKLYKFLTDLGKKVVIAQEPTNYTLTGYLLRILLNSRDEFNPYTYAFYFIADRIENWNRYIKKYLEEGYIVLSERYYYSTLAYQSVHGVEMDFLEKIHDYLINKGLLGKPDLVILLDVDPEIAIKRTNGRIKQREIFEKVDFLKKVREKYLELAKKYNFEIVNTNQLEESVVIEVLSRIRKLLFKNKTS